MLALLTALLILPSHAVTGEAGIIERSERVRPVVLVLASAPVAQLGGTPAQQRETHRRLRAGQKPLVAVLAQRGYPVITRFTRVLNGIQTRLPDSERGADWLQAAGVTRILEVLEHRPTLAHTVEHIGGGIHAATLGLDGSGVSIGIIDSGVDYIHLALGGPGTAEAYAANDGSFIDDGLDNQTVFYPNDRVVGGWDFAGADYVGAGGPLPAPDPDPMPDQTPNYEEHGTHVASIAAGSAGGEVAAGVAPGADIYALKVSSTGVTTLTAAAVEWASDPDGDGDTSDRLDVLNISLGTPYGQSTTDHKAATAEALEAFVALGGVVVASAGNSGDIPFVESSPGALSASIAVANTHGPGELATRLEVVWPPSLSGQHDAKAASTKLAPLLATTGPVEGPLFFGGQGCLPTLWPNPLQGGVALVERGGCPFIDKLTVATEAGAGAMVVIHNKSGAPTKMTGAPQGSIPAVMVEQLPGLSLAELVGGGQLGGGQVIQVRLGSDYLIEGLVDSIRPGSSRGPSAALWPLGPIGLSPDISAPGTHVRAAEAGTGDESTSKTGTSMAAPHVAGAAALIRQAHPDWSPAWIRSALIGTAMPEVLDAAGAPLPLTRQGAGRVDVVAAVSAPLLINPDARGLVDLGWRDFATDQTVVADLVLQNPTGQTVVASPGIEWRTGGQGVQATISSAPITLAPGGQATVIVQFEVTAAELPGWKLNATAPNGTGTSDGDRLTGSEQAGFVRFDTDEGTVRAPFYLLARPAPDTQTTTHCLPPSAGEVVLVNDGAAGTTRVFTLLGDAPDHETIQALGIRWLPEGDGARLEIALVAREASLFMSQPAVRVWIDTDDDGLADYLLRNLPQEFIEGDDDPSGRVEAILLTQPDASVVERSFVVGSLQSRARIVTTAGIPMGPLRIWIDDEIPIHHRSFDPECGQWVFDKPNPYLDAGSVQTLVAAQTPTCGLEVIEDGSKRPPPLLLLHGWVVSPDDVQVVLNPADDAFTCLEAITLEAGADGLAEVHLEDLYEAPPCGGEVTVESNAPNSIPYGAHTVTFATRDQWDRGTTCHTLITVPEPPPTPEPEPEPPVENNLQVPETEALIPDSTSGCVAGSGPVSLGGTLFLFVWLLSCTAFEPGRIRKPWRVRHDQQAFRSNGVRMGHPRSDRDR